ncbi:MAG TPA: EAL domain-containing protein [Geminicoccus sp.]|uniref:putative bifunctional diguanylate cyclase/phosphodiesterase n=1 Tax=Geminicoccus sp. TaxID=2024832 RepID=UPI002B62A2B5|nr:EAL domain-containing protein [Geminicoccus sp.]HWL70940.1 EAL domain-containing protein [Geminicoccus sp.]
MLRGRLFNLIFPLAGLSLLAAVILLSGSLEPADLDGPTPNLFFYLAMGAFGLIGALLMLHRSSATIPPPAPMEPRLIAGGTAWDHHVANLPLAVIQLDYRHGHPGRIAGWNRQAELIFGWRAEEACGRTLDELRLIHEADQNRRLAMYDAIRDQAVSSAQITLRACTRERRILHCAAHVSVARHDDGSLDSILIMVDDISSQIATQAEITRLAHHDALTGLPNRALFSDRLRQALSRARRDGDKVALMLIDLDDFKRVNDSHGHACGDALLQNLARTLSGMVRETDSPARLGGDEFALVQVGVTDLQAVEALATRLGDSLAQPFHWEGRHIETSCSIGVAIFPDDGTSDEELLRAADVALYQGKAAGRNRQMRYRREMDEELSRRRSMQARLQQAIDQERLQLVYQPILAMPDLVPVAAEALCRWHDRGQAIAPSTFVPLAESCGLIRPLGRWVLHTACRQAASWAEQGLQLRVAVNLGIPELLQPELVATIEAALHESRLPPYLLQIEISEAAVGDPSREAFIGSLNDLSTAGVGIAINGFGAGRMPLARLAGFPFDTIKLDGSLVGRIAQDPRTLAIARAVVTMAHDLGRCVTAERVETEEQLARLVEIGCDQVQGHLLSPPLAAADVAGRRLPILRPGRRSAP